MPLRRVENAILMFLPKVGYSRTGRGKINKEDGSVQQVETTSLGRKMSWKELSLQKTVAKFI